MCCLSSRLLRDLVVIGTVRIVHSIYSLILVHRGFSWVTLTTARGDFMFGKDGGHFGVKGY